MKILWVTPKWTLPAIDGARVATEKLLVNTNVENVSIDYLCFANKNELIDEDLMKEKWKINNIFVKRRTLPESRIKKAIYYILKICKNPFIPITFSSFSTKVNKSFLSQTLSKSDYDFVLFDGLHLASTLDLRNYKKILKKTKIIYRAHNIESDLWLKSYEDEKNIFKKMIFKVQYNLVFKFEKEIIDISDGVAAISQEDKNVIEKLSSSNKTFLAPLGMSFGNELPQVINNKTNLLFVGRLDWAPNKDGLKWILDEVWPKVYSDRKDIELHVVGSGNRSWLDKYLGTEGVIFHGFVESIEQSYKDSSFSIAPIRFGSGTRIKVIETFAYGRMLISTTMGVQGSTLTPSDYVCADSSDEWIEVLSSIKQTDEIESKLENTRSKMEKIFGEKMIGESFYRWLETFL